ncbi:MAG: midcut-by-XrtH protein [Pseudomonadota bacterium]
MPVQYYSAALLALMPNLASAGSLVVSAGFFSYGPETTSDPAGIPALGTGALLALIALVFIGALRALRNGNHSRLSSVALAMALAGLAALGGKEIVPQALATSFATLGEPDGGNANIVADVLNDYKNTSGAPLEIREVTILDSLRCLSYIGSESGECFEGVVLAPGANCQIDCRAQLSDARLKRDIRYLETNAAGLKLYRFSYLWSDEVYIGVMAQDLLDNPDHRDAVITQPSGYYAVDYSMLGIQMQRLDP